MDIKGIIFDMDGTLTVPTIDFVKIRQELGIPRGIDLIDGIEAMTEDKRLAAWRLIEKNEAEAPVIFQTSAKETLERFKRSGLQLGVLTRNTSKSAEKTLGMLGFDFDTILTREHTHVKPDPETVRYILNEWNLPPEKVVMVGDYIHDIECGNDAGVHTCFYLNPTGDPAYSDSADYTVSSFIELETIIFT